MKKTILIPIVITGSFAFAAEPVTPTQTPPTTAAPAAGAKGDFKSLDEPVPEVASEPKFDDASKYETFSAAVNVIRPNDGRVEVVFRNGDSFYLPRGAKNASFYKACEESSNSGKPITVTVNKRTRIMEQVSGASASGVKTPLTK